MLGFDQLLWFYVFVKEIDENAVREQMMYFQHEKKETFK